MGISCAENTINDFIIATFFYKKATLARSQKIFGRVQYSTGFYYKADKK